MKPDSFQDLYKLVRGSHLATLVIDAQNLASEREYKVALDRLTEARRAYSERYSKILRREPKGRRNTDPRQPSLPSKQETLRSPEYWEEGKKNLSRDDRKRIQKQEKIIQATMLFDQLISQLETRSSTLPSSKLPTASKKSRSASKTVRSVREPRERQIAPANKPAENYLELRSPFNPTAKAREETRPNPPSESQESSTSSQLLQNRVSDLPQSIRGRLKQAMSQNENLRAEALLQFFHLIEIRLKKDLQPNAIYFIQTEKISLLVKIESLPLPNDPLSKIRLTSVLDNRPIKSIPLRGLLKLASSKQLFSLHQRTITDDHSEANHKPKEGITIGSAQETSADVAGIKNQITSHGVTTTDLRKPADKGSTTEESNPEGDSRQVLREAAGIPERQTTQTVLDLGSFSQLLTSAQRSGLVPNADQVGYVRDKEFRLGHFDKAFQSIDIMHNRFLASAAQRLSRLSREDADIAAGRIKISPRELQAKRSRDRTQTQEIDRAKRRFQVVLEGLRILMNR